MTQYQLEPFPDKEKYILKPKFIERYQELLHERYDEFINYSFTFPRKAIRINTLKIDIQSCKSRLEALGWVLEQVPWFEASFWIHHTTGRRDIGSTIEHALGYFYVQDPASLIPPLALDPKPGEHILDTCAAPGSKTTQIAQLMNNKGKIVANELTGSRIAALGINLQRCGVQCCIINRSDANRIPKSMQFDKIMVDGPCSGTGTIRKSPKTILMWNPALIKRLARIQLTMLRNAYKHLKPGGTLVYSTCTLEPDENEGVVSAFLQEHSDMDVADIQLNINRSPAILTFEGEIYDPRVSKSLRIYPQDNNTEGFFVCKMTKMSPVN